jgi:hypothetical protein
VQCLGQRVVTGDDVMLAPVSLLLSPQPPPRGLRSSTYIFSAAVMRVKL